MQSHGCRRTKLERLRGMLEAAEADAVVATSPANVFYMTGFSSASQRLVPATQVFAILSGAETTTLIIPSVDADVVAMLQPDVDDVLFYGTFFVEEAAQSSLVSDAESILQPLLPSMASGESFLDVVRDVVCREGLDRKTLLVDEGNLNFKQFEALKQALPHCSLEACGDRLKRIRRVKFSTEIESLRQASSVTEKGLSAMFSRVRPGVSEIELRREFQIALISEGASPFFESIAGGSRSCFPNAIPRERPLRVGDLVRFDGGCKYHGYCSDISRVAVVGKPAPRLQQYYNALLAGLQVGLEQVKPGVSAARVFSAVMETVRNNGIPDYRRHHCGHGIGLEMYEPPLIAPSDETVLEEGMVLCLETPYYELGLGGLQVEDMIVVTSQGCDLLTQLDHHLLRV